MVALYLTLASVTAVYCLLGYWLAFGKSYWLWRAAAVCIALVLLVPIRAYEPLVFFGMTSLLFVAAASCRRLFLWWWERRRKVTEETHSAVRTVTKANFQFRLHDLLGLMAVIGAALWMARILFREQVVMPWLGTWLAAAFAVATTFAVSRLVAGPKRLITGSVLIAFVACPVIAFRFSFRPITSASFCVVGDYLGNYLFDYYPWHSALIVFVSLALFVVFLALGFAMPRALWRNPTASIREGIWRSVVATAIAAWFVSFGWLYYHLLSLPQPPSKDRQQANSFPLILERGERIEFVAPAQARMIAADVLALTRQPGFVALPWDGTYAERRDFDFGLLHQVQTARSIARGLDAQVTLREPTDPDQAADYAIGILRIGDMLGHEGQIIHSLVGLNALEEIGRTDLVRLRTKVSPQKGRELLRILQQVESNREPLETTIEREEAWRDLNDRWRFRLYRVLVQGNEQAIGWDGRESYDQIHGRRPRYICSAQLLITDLALRAYHQDYGEYPANLKSLSPDYLRLVPLDLFSGKPFRYRRGDSDFVLYSAGTDGVDNGGKFGNLQQVTYHPDGFDLDLEALTRK